MEAKCDRQGIAELVRLRLVERYVEPIEASTAKHGFASVALGCLLIETLQSFREGCSDTRGESSKMFKNFFGQNHQFKRLAPRHSKFYHAVRCGLLHQGETRQGWTIVRRGPLFDDASRRLNGTQFIRAVRTAVNQYGDELRNAGWDAAVWRNCHKKLSAVVKNCRSG
jgi:hypothetical protein